MRFTPTAIKRLRKRLGLTQIQFAEAVGVTERAVAYWEAGTRGVSGLAQRAIERMKEERDG
jgi:DNA-binding transcriptional regulator YiaG